MKRVHDIVLGQYTPSPSYIDLGTADSYGIEQLRLIRSENWVGLTVTAAFSPMEGEPVEVAADDADIIEVPPEATENAGGQGVIVIVGAGENQQRISTNLRYTVQGHGAARGSDPGEVTPSLLQQLIARVQGWYEEIQGAILEAKAAADGLRRKAEAGEFDGKPGEDGKDGVTPDLKIGTVRTVDPEAPANASITGTAEKPVLNLDIPQGQPGQGGGSGGTADHNALTNRNAPDQHPMSAITGLETALLEIGQVFESLIDPIQWLDFTEEQKTAAQEKLGILSVEGVYF